MKKTLLALAIACSAALALLAQPPSFQDEFSLPSLDAAWTIRPGVPQTVYSLTANPGFLRYSLLGSTPPGSTNTLWLHRPFTGTSWTLDAKVHCSFPFGLGRQIFLHVLFGGLTQREVNEARWWHDKDDGDFIPANRNRTVGQFIDGGLAGGVPGSGFGGDPTLGFAVAATPPDVYFVRLIRNGQVVTVQQSLDGISYTTLVQRAFTTPLGTLQTIVIDGGSFSGAAFIDFDYISVEAVDTTGPVLTPTITGTPGLSGWYRSAVNVSWTVTDPETSVTSTTGCVPTTLPSDTPGTSLTCTATSGGGTSSQTVVIKIDQTPPSVIFGSPSPAANGAGWNRTDVMIPFATADTGSGVNTSSSASPLVISAEGPALSASVTATDNAGNAITVNSPVVHVDKSAPSLVGIRSPAPNAAGWNNSAVTVSFTCTDPLSGVAALTPAAPLIMPTSGAAQSASGTCVDVAGNISAVAVAGINIDLDPPVVESVSASPSVVPSGAGFTLSAAVTDSLSGVGSADYSVDGGPFLPMTGSPNWTAQIAPLPVGVHTVCVLGRDIAGNSSALHCTLVPVFDPSAGFVTGGGWITSPPGAYTAAPTISGKAVFGFVSRYHHGANTPSGETHFQFQAAGMKFASISYDWLVISGGKAQFKGLGAINGEGEYRFLLTAFDGDLNNGSGADALRIRIWRVEPGSADGGIVYDNKLGSADTSADATTLGGGSIVIHKP